MAHFEALGRNADRDFIRSLARRLAENGPAASRLRAAVGRSIAAVAEAHRCTVVTDNEKDFADLAVINPLRG
jgi:predicted nucleic acid-binding protein